MNPVREGPDAIFRATQLVEHVLQDVWEEFRLWKDDYVARTLSSLTSQVEDAPNSSALENAVYEAGWNSGSGPMHSEEYVEVFDCETQTTERVPLELIHLNEVALPPLPAHEYCTPIERNMFLGDDPRELPFIPFADDPSFDRARYLEEYNEFSWEEPAVDPDLEAIVVEAARRLHDDDHMPYRHIDETGVLPLELLDRDRSRGMVFRSRRRDFPAWPPGVPASAKILHDDTPAIAAVPDKQLAVLVSTFCTNFNCLTGFCTTHLDAMPMPLSTPPAMKNARMAQQASSPCGADCFVLAPSEQPIRWSAVDIDLLRTILDFSPDTLPCDLATICAKPCFEVFAQRCTTLPDSSIGRKLARGRSKPRLGRVTSALKFSDFDTQNFTPVKPCRHEGPCDAAAQCICFLNKAHCESSCRCNRKCARRWRGCKCTRKGATCGTDSCACFLAHRECDPELCLKCQARGALYQLDTSSSLIFNAGADARADVCQNTDIQYARWKRTTVAPGRWGIGLFMAEVAEPGDLIIEYIGELIYDPTADSREPIAMHRGRNYLFQLNSTLSVDGTYAANAARYINHDARAPSCRARVRMVNGEHRIGIYAIKKLNVGEEVLFNYGDHFFTAPEHGKRKEKEKEKEQKEKERGRAGAAEVGAPT
ncbi:SET domain-containing protein [Mycena belliarum]|uniref:SET domain-containing protein n=1 Tax=Mycena belliarum TaxID=1033014 RepID=A0AAD6U573_9AGAR|nr:SET domain-containing protein [Mycena belliae]